MYSKYNKSVKGKTFTEAPQYWPHYLPHCADLCHLCTVSKSEGGSKQLTWPWTHHDLLLKLGRKPGNILTKNKAVIPSRLVIIAFKKLPRDKTISKIIYVFMSKMV